MNRPRPGDPPAPSVPRLIVEESRLPVTIGERSGLTPEYPYSNERRQGHQAMAREHPPAPRPRPPGRRPRPGRRRRTAYARGAANPNGSTTALRADVLGALGVLKVATAGQLQRLLRPRATSNKAVRQALGDLALHGLVASDGNTKDRHKAWRLERIFQAHRDSATGETSWRAPTRPASPWLGCAGPWRPGPTRTRCPARSWSRWWRSSRGAGRRRPPSGTSRPTCWKHPGHQRYEHPTSLVPSSDGVEDEALQR